MRRGGRRIAKALAWGALMIMLLPFVLTLVYAVVPPVSTLMLQRWVMGESVDRRWRALDGISPALPVAVAMSEDARFCRHRGVDYEALRTVLDQADDEGPSRGASTIAMQTARNLFLWQGRSYVRKALEIVLAHWLDLVWSKRRVMEVYLNIAEWGEGVFGAEAAAQHAFRRSAQSLTREQAALLAAILPNPLRRSAGRPSPGVRRIARRILVRMVGAAPWLDCLGLRSRGIPLGSAGRRGFARPGLHGKAEIGQAAAPAASRVSKSAAKRFAPEACIRPARTHCLTTFRTEWPRRPAVAGGAGNAWEIPGRRADWSPVGRGLGRVRGETALSAGPEALGSGRDRGGRRPYGARFCAARPGGRSGCIISAACTLRSGAATIIAQ